MHQSISRFAAGYLPNSISARQPRNHVTRHSREIRSSENSFATRTDDEIRDLAVALREAHRNEAQLPRQALYDAIGLVAESVFRVHGFRLHDVQLQGIVAGSQGAIVEMQTGEGKTLVTGATAAIKAICWPGIHVGTTNAYLAQRDLENMMPIFQRLGFTAGLLPDENDNQKTQQAYRKDITYGPGYQFGFDYLRDQVELRNNRQSRLGCRTMNSITGHDPSRQLKQPADHFVAIIDEADSVMIDEAVTPLVISGSARTKENPTPFKIAQKLAAKLTRDVDFVLVLPEKKLNITEAALARCHETIAARKDLELARPWKSYITNALRAQWVLQRDVDYVVSEGEVRIVDQFTGRIFSDRTWQDGLHQAVESKEEVEIQSAPPTVARITRQRYLQLYDQLAGFTGTATGARHEFRTVYRCPVIAVPTNLKCIRKNHPSRFFADKDAKIAAIVADVLNRHKTGQPILIGTRTIRESYEINNALTANGIAPVLLNGVQDEEESEIVARAGEFRAITIATNMAGRGTDIKPDQRALDAGGLHVLGVSPNGSPRIDRQLIGRAARQGKPGSSQFFVAADDEIIATHSPELGRKIIRRASRNGESTVKFSKPLIQMQQMVEMSQYKVRQAMILQDHWMDQVRESIEKE